MRRPGYRLFGVVALIGGTALLASSSRQLLADPFPDPKPKCNTFMPSVLRVACTSNITVCEGQPENVCKGAGTFYQVEMFPENCTGGQVTQRCDKPLANCYVEATCKWDTEATPPSCSGTPKAGAAWKSNPKPTDVPCDPDP